VSATGSEPQATVDTSDFDALVRKVADAVSEEDVEQAQQSAGERLQQPHVMFALSHDDE
jgi:hypothetical protein